MFWLVREEDKCMFCVAWHEPKHRSYHRYCVYWYCFSSRQLNVNQVTVSHRQSNHYILEQVCSTFSWLSLLSWFGFIFLSYFPYIDSQNTIRQKDKNVFWNCLLVFLWHNVKDRSFYQTSVYIWAYYFCLAQNYVYVKHFCNLLTKLKTNLADDVIKIKESLPMLEQYIKVIWLAQ